ncbi:alpha/beta-hydrolase [Xylaria bambusicola]|uniref:alpha/beta-hydrolase n=1 Tax=Xylaria bambusicola TaxID=326684 RepID=UPI0020075857|nr:alpha/beta-hydrolase [Xylaria bambusicola]KAI0520875.1 alpha/beta-hydrolase [Xylaria bambusicola]
MTSPIFNRLIPELERVGYAAVAPNLPSSGTTPPTPNWDQDIEVICRTISKLVVERDVVVGMQSFSGMTGGTALEGLDKIACATKGWKGGVVRLIYITAFLVLEGSQHLPRGTRDSMVPEMKTDMEKGRVTVMAEDPEPMFYQDIDDDTVAALAKELRPQSLGSYWDTATIADFIDAAKASGSHGIDKVIEVDSSHSPFISKPE